MADGRKRSSAKQARRDARRRKARRERQVAVETADDIPLIDEVREALDGGQPVDLLGLVSMLIEATSTELTYVRSQRGDDDQASLDELVAAFIDVRVPETTALLAALGELVLHDDVLRDRCRREVQRRDDDLPRWLAELAQTTVTQVVRMTHVLGDGDELLLGVRFSDGQELTCAVYVDHLSVSGVKDAFFVPNTIAAVLDVARASNTDPDTSFVDVRPADGSAELQQALENPLAKLVLEESDTWPSSRPLVCWLTRIMPADGANLRAQQQGWVDSEELLNRFFASLVGMPFARFDYRLLLALSIDRGTGDPVRWSAPRLRQLLTEPIAPPDEILVDVQLKLPELLSAFVPFAHAESGIRAELTAEALAMIDEEADDYRELVLEEAREWAADDDDDVD